MDTELDVAPERQRAVKSAEAQNIKDAIFILKVMNRVRETGLSIYGACADLKVSYSTFRSKCRKPAGKAFLQKFQEETIKQAALNITANMGVIVQRQIEIATDQRFRAQDATAAAAWIDEFREKHTDDSTSALGGATLAGFKKSFAPIQVPIQVNVSIEGGQASTTTIADVTEKAGSED